MSNKSDTPEDLAAWIIGRYGDDALAKIDSMVAEAIADGDLVGQRGRWEAAREVIRAHVLARVNGPRQ